MPELLADLIGGTMDGDHVRAHWGEALRLAVSVGSGHTSASGMLRRLAAYPRQNGLAVALREIGRIDHLEHAVQLAQGAGARHQHTPPRHRADPEQLAPGAVR